MDERMVTKLRVKEANVRTYRDHESGIHLVKNQVYHERTKHTDVWLYFVWEVISKKKVTLEKVCTSDNPISQRFCPVRNSSEGFAQREIQALS